MEIDKDNDDVQSDGEDWRRPVDEVVYQVPKSPSVTKRVPGKHSSSSTANQGTGYAGDSLLVSKLGHVRTIIHIDIDCFYAQVEMIRNPELRNKPLGIQQKYLLVTCNYVARERGVGKLMGIKEAKEKCPDLVLVSGEDLTHYREMSYKISECLQKYTTKVERLGFDENFIDVSEMVEQRLALKNYTDTVNGFVYGAEESPHLPDGDDPCPCGCHLRLAVGSQIATDIREALHLELGITCCAGIAHNKLMSKLVAGTHKPNQQTTLLPKDAAKLLSSLSKASKIPGIGWTTSKKLSGAGIHSVTDVQECDMAVLVEECGAIMAATIKQLSHGVDDSPVVPYSRPQTISDEDSFKKCTTVSQARQKIEELLSSLLKRLVEDGRTPHTFRLAVRRIEGPKYTSRESKQCPVPAHVFHKIGKGDVSSAHEHLTKIGMSLFEKLVNVKQPFHLTLINVAFAKLEERSTNDISSFFLSQKFGHQNQADDKVCPAQNRLQDSDSCPSENENLKSKSSRSRGLDRMSLSENSSRMSASNHKTVGTNVHETNEYNNISISQSQEHRQVKMSSASGHMEAKEGTGFFRKKQISKSSPRKYVSDSWIVDKTNVSETERSASEGITTTTTETGASSDVQQDSNLESQSATASSVGPASDVCLELPDGIDPVVFAQLPSEVQDDILGDFQSTRARKYGSERPGRRSERSLSGRKQSNKRQRKTSDKSELSIEQLVPRTDHSSPRNGHCGPAAADLDTGCLTEKSTLNEHIQEALSSECSSVGDGAPFKKKKRLFSPEKSKHKESSDSDTNNNTSNHADVEFSEVSNTGAIHNVKEPQVDTLVCKSSSKYTKESNVTSLRSDQDFPDLNIPQGTQSISESYMCDKMVNESQIAFSSSPTKCQSSASTSAQTSTNTDVSSHQIGSNLPRDGIIPASSLETSAKPDPQYRCVTGPAPAVPPDMDEDVFRSLPVEIQAELSLQWQFQNIKKSSTAANRTSESKKKSPKVAQPKTKNPTLLNFFRSKN